MLIGILMHVSDADDPYGIIDTLLHALPSGSQMAVVHPTADFDSRAMTALAATVEQYGIPYVPRTREQVLRFFSGLELVEPGLVPILAWRPDDDTSDDIYSVYAWAAVGRKP